ncbi:Sds3-like-domain-containing protein [Annulohypoxylon maeteangense]|uniref:Sds3-like-domain-containing protein n=1 Tax=Annulohypoxylon maeteangense TaxID=1927788 RepID=UPI00200859E5|nr:Sds3-like-domain-containing protein [Annulohypoxylon maeteangense]KAI0885361.1 Sds3-like-domain-containing protein [Annulohypoxylon maeteangense]
MATAEPISSSALVTTSNKTIRPSPPPPSKRDKKRQALNDRLAGMQDQYSRDKDKHYRDELHKIQIDVNLVARVDPYAERPLDVIDREYRDILQSAKAQLSANASSNGSPKRSLLEMAGPTFSEWVYQVEDLVEHRDYEMTCQKMEYERKTSEHEKVRAYKLEVAKREHQTLSNTLRDRLSNAISGKKFRLGKEKEALDISDGSALLLHPNQFSLTNPASPGGTHGKRNTRQRREMDEMPGFSENKKRKRNGADDEGSPAPKRGALDSSNTTPFWSSDRLRSGSGGTLRKESGPIYSVDKLFTDKELAMTYNVSALAAHKHMVRRDTNGNIITPDENGLGNGEINDDEDPSAVTMERQPSHTTRSTRGGHGQQNFYDDQLLGIEGLANFEIPGNLDKMGTLEPKLPPLTHAQYSKAYRRDDSNTPQPLSDTDRDRDLSAMKLLRAYQTKHGVGANLNVNNGGRRLLEAMTAPLHNSKYVAYIQGQRPSAEAMSESLGIQESDLRDDSNARPNNTGNTTEAKDSPAEARDSAAGVAMSRQSSLGGAAMSRSGSARSKRKT